MTTPPNMIVLPNAAYAGKTPRKLQAACHDRSPFITLVCGCGSEMHLHETQIAGAPDDAELATRCKACGNELVLVIGQLTAAFQSMRDDGWID